MAFFYNLRPLFFVLVLFSFAIFCCKSEDEFDGDPYESGNPGQFVDPAQIVAKALLCFNNKVIYSSCEESYRLTQSGNLNVPPEATDHFCSGPCLAETNLVLNCVHNIMTHYLFYNRATIQDVRATLRAGCSYSSDRGNFDVLEHLDSSNAQKHTHSMNIYMLIFLGGLWLYHY